MKKPTPTAARFHAAKQASTSPIARAIASEVMREIQTFKAAPDTLIAAAMAVHPGRGVVDALEAVLASVRPLRALVADQTAMLREAEGAMDPAFRLVEQRQHEIAREIELASEVCRLHVDAFERPMLRWEHWVKQGFSHDEILQKGIPVPACSGDAELRNIRNEASAIRGETINRLVTERDGLNRFKNTWDTSSLTPEFRERLRQVWTDPLEAHPELLEGCK